MSFHLSASTSQSQNNQMNFDDNFTGINDDKLEFSLDPDKFVKFPKFPSNHDQNNDKTEMCFDYSKCFTNQFQYDANNFAYSSENTFCPTITTTPAVEQQINADQFAYGFDDGPHQLQNQMGMCKLLTEFQLNFCANIFEVLPAPSDGDANNA